MQRIVIVCSHYFEDSDANAICVRNLVSEFINYGYFVYIITDPPLGGMNNDLLSKNVEFHFVSEDYYSLFSKQLNVSVSKTKYTIVSVFRRFINVFIYPNVAYKRAKKVCGKARELLSLNDIDIYLATYRPYESIYAGIRLSSLFQTTSFFSYHLDNIETNKFTNPLIHRYLMNKSNKVFQIEKRAFDRVFVTTTSQLVGQNVVRLGLPLLKRNDIVPYEYHFDKRFYNIVYIGSLDLNNRNPRYIFNAFKIFNELSNKKIKIHVWGCVSNLDDVFDLYKEFVVYNGKIDNKYVESIYENADCLLNVGNQITTDMLPSKLFHMFATNKEIITFNKEDDLSLPYLRKYAKSIIHYYSDIEGFETNRTDLFSKNERISGIEKVDLSLFKPEIIVRKMVDYAKK